TREGHVDEVAEGPRALVLAAVAVARAVAAAALLRGALIVAADRRVRPGGHRSDASPGRHRRQRSDLQLECANLIQVLLHPPLVRTAKPLGEGAGMGSH